MLERIAPVQTARPHVWPCRTLLLQEGSLHMWLWYAASYTASCHVQLVSSYTDACNKVSLKNKRTTQNQWQGELLSWQGVLRRVFKTTYDVPPLFINTFFRGEFVACAYYHLNMRRQRGEFSPRKRGLGSARFF